MIAYVVPTYDDQSFISKGFPMLLRPPSLRPIRAGILLLMLICLIDAAPARPTLAADCAPSLVAPTQSSGPAALTPARAELALVRTATVGGTVAAVAGGDGRRYSGLGGSLRIEPSGATAFPRVELPDAVRDIAPANGLAYVAAGSAGLQVVAPTPPYLRGELRTPGLVAALRIAGTRAYLAAAGNAGGLQLIDLSAPTAPRLLSRTPTYGSASALDVAGSLVYVAGGLGGGIEVFDVTDPLSPTLRGALITPGAALGVAVSGQRAYVAGGTCGLQVLDLSDPARPQLLGALATGDEARAVLVHGQRVFVAAGGAGLAGFTITAGLPTPLGRATLPPSGPGTPQAIDLAIDGDRLLVAAETGVYSLSLSAPFPAALTAERETAGGVVAAHSSAAGRVFIGLSGGAAIDATGADGGGQPLGPRFTTPGPALDLADNGAALYVAAGDGGLAVFDTAGSPQAAGAQRIPQQRITTDDGRPTTDGQLGTVWQSSVVGRRWSQRATGLPGTVLPLPGSASAVVVSSTVGYVAGGVAGLHQLDLSDPLSPTLSLTIDTPGAALGLALAGELAYVADRSGLQVVDLAAGTLRGRYSAPAGSFVQDVALVGARAYLADRSGLLVVDVSDPDQPALVGGAAGFTAYRLLISGGLAYLAAGKDGLLVFSLANPASPRLVGAYDTPGSAQDLALRGDTLVVADNSGGLLVLRRVPLSERVFLPLTAS